MSSSCWSAESDVPAFDMAVWHLEKGDESCHKECCSSHLVCRTRANLRVGCPGDCHIARPESRSSSAVQDPCAARTMPHARLARGHGKTRTSGTTRTSAVRRVLEPLRPPARARLPTTSSRRLRPGGIRPGPLREVAAGAQDGEAGANVLKDAGVNGWRARVATARCTRGERVDPPGPVRIAEFLRAWARGTRARAGTSWSRRPGRSCRVAGALGVTATDSGTMACPDVPRLPRRGAAGTRT